MKKPYQISTRFLPLYFIFNIIGLVSLSYAAQHHPQEFLNSIQHDKNAPEKIYQHYCVLCHDKNPRIPVGAPRLGVKTDWELRRKKGIDGLYKTIDKGIGAMPARGGCFECSDSLLKDTIQYMLKSSEQGH